MLKKSLLLTLLAVFFVACGGGQSGHKDVKKVIAKMNQAIAALEVDLKAVKSADDAAAAFTKFNKTTKGLKPEMDKLQKKYPKLGKKGAKLPADLQAESDKLEKAGKKMAMAMIGVMMKYGKDPKVMKAMKEMGKM